MYLSAGTAALRAAMPAAMIEGRLHATATTYVTDTARALQALHTMRACLQSSSGARSKDNCEKGCKGEKVNN